MSQDIGATLTIFATQMLGLSVAAERVTETIKQWLNSKTATATPPADGSNPTPATLQVIAGKSAGYQALAFVSGMFVVTLAHVDPLDIVTHWGWVESKHCLVHHAPRGVSIIVTGLLVSGGSTVWNNILDLLTAAKVNSEQATNATLANAKQPPIAA